MTEAIEAVKCALRQTDKGMVVSFVLHPNDRTDHLVTMKIGQRVMLAVAPITESEMQPGAPHVRKKQAAMPDVIGPRPGLGSDNGDDVASPNGDDLSTESGLALSPGGQVDRADTPHSPVDEADVPPSPSKPQERKPRTLANVAGMLCSDKAFHKEMCVVQKPGLDMQTSAEIELKETLDIDSFKQIDADWPKGVQAKFLAFKEHFDRKVGRAPRLNQ